MATAYSIKPTGDFNLGDITETDNIVVSTAGSISLKGTAVKQPVTITSIGTATSEVYVMGIQTTDATPTDLTFDGSAAAAAHGVPITTNSNIMIRADVTARQSGGTNVAAYEIMAVIKDIAGTSTLASTSTTTLYEDTAGWDAVCNLDDTNSQFYIRATGSAATTIDWVARITTTVTVAA